MSDGKLSEKDQCDLVVEAWKKTVDVQQHFNDLQLRIRTFSITFLAALLSVAGLVFKDDKASRLPAYLVFLGVPSLAAFWFMDRHMYHRLLKGVGEHAGVVESQLGTMMGSEVFGLSTQISKASRVEPAWYTLKKEVRSTQKLNLFYGALAALMMLMSIGFYASSRLTARSQNAVAGAMIDSMRASRRDTSATRAKPVIAADSMPLRADTVPRQSRQVPPR